MQTYMGNWALLTANHMVDCCPNQRWRSKRGMEDASYIYRMCASFTFGFSATVFRPECRGTFYLNTVQVRLKLTDIITLTHTNAKSEKTTCACG
jgi:hypothetical protein